MKPADNINEFFKKAAVSTNPKMDEAVLDKVLIAHEKAKNTRPALAESTLRRTIMRSPIAKLGTAAAVIAVIVLGLFEFIDTENKSGVVWADVAQKVQASRGVIFRSRDVGPDSRAGGPDYTMNYFSDTQARHDSYKGDQIIKTIYGDFNTKTVILVDHGHKSYVKMTVENMKQDGFVTDPKIMVQRFLSHEYRKLGQKTVESVLCEGIETTDRTFSEGDFQVDSLVARAWVSVETGYPVRFEDEEVRNKGQIRIGTVWDQFQWDTELDKSMFKPDIPPDYIDISP